MRKGCVLAMVSLMAMCLLGGCGSKTEKIEQGMQQIKEMDYAGAIVTFDEAESLGEDARLIARGRGIACMGQTEYEMAIGYFQESLLLSDGLVRKMDYDLNYYMALAYARIGDYASAEKTYSAILALREEAEGFYLRGTVRLALGQYNSAKEDFDKVVQMEPQNYGRLIQIYQSLEAFSYKEAGEVILRDCMNANAEKMSDLDKGRFYYYLGEYQMAASCLETARNKEDSSEASHYLGMSYEALGEYNYASNVYESYLAKGDKKPALYNQLGLCFMKMGKYKDALNSFQTGMKIEGNDVYQSLCFNEIVCYEYLGDFKKAAALMQNYLGLYPDDPEALREQIFLSTR